MRPVLRRLIAVAAAVVPTIAAVLFVIPAPAAFAAAETNTYELHDKDFGTVCRSDTSSVQIHVQYSSFTINSPTVIDSGQYAKALRVRAYDTQNANLVISTRKWGTSDQYYYGTQSWDHTELLTPEDGIPATGEWQQISTFGGHVGPSGHSYSNGPSWSRGEDFMSLTFWLNNTIADCTVDITFGYQSPGWICDGKAISSADGMALLESVGYATLDYSEQQNARAGLCEVLAYFDADNYEVVADPGPAAVEVAGVGAPPRRFPVPDTTRSDGTTAACPHYTQAAIVRAREDIVELPTGPWIWIQRNVLRIPESQLTPTFQLRAGDPLASLSVTVDACTAGGRFTSVSPPPGQQPSWRPILTAPATLLGYSKPTSPLNMSHNFTNPPANTQLESSARAVFPYSADIGIVQIPENVTALSNLTLGTKLTIYSDGTWTYALEGGS